MPLLKKSAFQTVSSLPFVSKVLEKAVMRQLQKHLSDSSLMDVRQSVYRKDHSTQTVC